MSDERVKLLSEALRDEDTARGWWPRADVSYRRQAERLLATPAFARLLLELDEEWLRATVEAKRREYEEQGRRAERSDDSSPASGRWRAREAALEWVLGRLAAHKEEAPNG